MISRSVESALGSEVFSHVVVSTDDDDIAKVAQQAGASVPFRRPKDLAGDHATTAVVLKHALEALGEQGFAPDAVCCLYPTAPFTTPDDLREGRDALMESGAGAVMPVVRFEYPIWRSLTRRSDGRVAMRWPEHRDARSQDLPEAYHDAGQWYWFRPEYLFRHGSLLGPDTVGVPVPSYRVHDIDVEDDWRSAELKHEALFPDG